MPFKLGTKTIQLDTPFTHNDIQYPANWIRLASQEDKSAIGMTWEADPVRADDRYYWGGDINNPKALDDKEEIDKDGNPAYVKVLSKDSDGNSVMIDSSERLISKGLKSNFIAQIKHTAGSILAQTDWMVIRKAERDVDLPTTIANYRASIVTKADQLEAKIKAVKSVEELASLDLSFPSLEN
jgi:hypothetical protein